MTKSDVDVVNEVLEVNDRPEYIVETTAGTVTYEIREPTRGRRWEFIETLPDELVSRMQSQQEEKKDELDVDNISEADLNEVEVDDTPSPAILGREEVEEFERFIYEHLEHPSLSQRETRDFMQKWSDAQVFNTGFIILAISGETEEVRDFRTER